MVPLVRPPSWGGYPAPAFRPVCFDPEGAYGCHEVVTWYKTKETVIFTMRSMMLTGIRQMGMAEVPEPAIERDTDVKIRMQVVGVCGSDVHYYQTGRIGSQVVHYPFPVGHEGAGIVVETGSRVTRVGKGSRIAIDPAMPCWQCDQCRSGRPHTCRKLRFLGCPGQADGCLSEYIVMPESSCIPLSSGLTLDQAALSEPLAIGVYAVKMSGAVTNARIAILGSGPIGMSVLLAARQRGAAAVYMTDLIDARLGRVKKAGARWTGNAGRDDVTGRIGALEPEGLDIVFECCGKQEAVDQAFIMLKPGGRLIIVGIPEFDTWRIPVDSARHKEIAILNIRRQVGCVEEALLGMEEGRMNAGEMVSHRFSFEEAPQAFACVAGYKDGVMKALVDFRL